MKLSTIIAGALATVAAAAPAKVEEEKRTLGAVGGAFGGNAFNVGAGAFALASPFAFGVGNVVGNVLAFDPLLLASVNQFNFANANVAALLASNGFQLNSVFNFVNNGFGIENFANIFSFGAGNVLGLQQVIDVNNLLLLQWLDNNFQLSQFGGGFNGLFAPTLNLDIFAAAGLGLGNQFFLQDDLLDLALIQQLSGGLVNNGFDAFSQFNFGLNGLGQFANSDQFSQFSGVLKE